LSVLAVLALAIMIEKAILYGRYTRLSGDLERLVETEGPAWDALDRRVAALGYRNYFGRFFQAMLANRDRPVWWIESRAAAEMELIEAALARRLWILETIVTAAPLLGLMGTILGMMHSFQLLGDNGLVNPTGVTGGVAQALIATALGLLIALIALFGFNYFSRRQARTLDKMEWLCTWLIDLIRLDRQGENHETA
jgi:biopolymer transport protein ExbB